ncbi:hypothetical protein [uncultured Tateyamaria sp.]|uniref:hypothetical protein n=1 Tax=Tateyamaria sp. 1078 TaxID=3417464 RepID=UPI0026052410|nr:hypothetical protein [uncultured Tateyamaria sp.]
MAHKHPIGDDHPFPAVYALAQAGALPALKLVTAYDGALMRLYTQSPDLVFKLHLDPGSAMDRQRFDYHKHIRIDPGTPEEILAQIKAHIEEHGQDTARPTPRRPQR